MGEAASRDAATLQISPVDGSFGWKAAIAPKWWHRRGVVFPSQTSHSPTMTKAASGECLALGYNCETAFQIERRFGAGGSCFFSWGIFSIEAIIRLVGSKFDHILHQQNLEWDNTNRLASDRAYGYSFHGPWKSGDPLSDPEFSTKLSEYRDKASYLGQKFLNPTQPRIYFYKQRKPSVPASVLRLANALQAISSESTLVLLRSTHQPPTAAEHPILYERVLSRFAPESDAKNADSSSWDAVFDEFS